MTTYKPGTVARFVGDHFDGIVFRFRDLSTGLEEWQSATEGCAYPTPDQLRPLVVLDLPHPDLAAKVMRQVAGFIREHHGCAVEDSTYADMIADQIEQQTRPPKPAEPTGLGAVVEDSHGKRWTRYDCQGDPQPWWCDGAGPDIPVERRFSYDDIDAVRVLSEGVKP